MTEAETEVDVTLGAAVDLFLASLKKGRTEAKQELAKFLRWFGREHIPGALTPPDLESYGEAATTSVVGGERNIKAVREFLTFAKKKGLVSTSLAQHVRVRRVSRGRRPSQRSASTTSNVVHLTAEGRKEKEEQLDWLREEVVRNSVEIQKAAADKDVRENAPLEAARQRQGQLASRIREIEDTLERAQLLQGSAGSGGAAQPARLGSSVTLKNRANGQELTYVLVDPREANPSNGKLSITSPVGQAVLDRAQGQELEVAAPQGTVHFQIVKVE